MDRTDVKIPGAVGGSRDFHRLPLASRRREKKSRQEKLGHPNKPVL